MTFSDELPEQQQLKRPVFLTVLCILTYVGCGLGILSALYQLVAGDPAAQMRVSMMRTESAGGMVGEMSTQMLSHTADFVKWTRISNYISLANGILCLAGALLMWKQRKMGFFIYVVGQLLLAISFTGMFLVVKDIPIMGVAMISVFILSAVFYVAFIIMYALNLKHMR